jgi:hypothetical protein
VLHHGRSNNYTFIHKGTNITLLPLTPNEIIRADRERAEMLKSENSTTTPPPAQPFAALGEHPCDPLSI